MIKKQKKEKRVLPVRSSGENIIKPDDRPSKVLFDKVVAAEKNDFDLLPTSSHHLPLASSGKETNISPKRDYTKVANSIARDAVPSGLFKGTSKNTYDVLYLRTRGAVVPRRIIKAVQSDLLVWANISHNTLRAHLKHLQTVGLLKIHYNLGDNKGAEYELFLPEEINLEHLNPPTTTPYHHPLPPPPSNQNLVGGRSQNLLGGGGGLMLENIEQTNDYKTSLKTRGKNDDELARKISAKLRETHGRELSEKEKSKINLIEDAVAQMIGAGFEKAATISDAINFALEHLNRLHAKPPATEKLPPRKKDEVGKHDFDRMAELAVWRDLLGDGGAVKDFEQYRANYAVEDWQWLMNEIAK